MSIYSVSISDDAWTMREPFQSVGLVCRCGAAVAGIEGVLTPCAKCGASYFITVMQYAAPKREAVSPHSETAA